MDYLNDNDCANLIIDTEEHVSISVLFKLFLMKYIRPRFSNPAINYVSKNILLSYNYKKIIQTIIEF